MRLQNSGFKMNELKWWIQNDWFKMKDSKWRIGNGGSKIQKEFNSPWSNYTFFSDDAENWYTGVFGYYTKPFGTEKGS